MIRIVEIIVLLLLTGWVYIAYKSWKKDYYNSKKRKESSGILRSDITSLTNQDDNSWKKNTDSE